MRCFHWALALAVSALLLACLPAVASAAECTDTWTGPAEGPWHNSEDWSAERVPTEADVACIGAGKTVKVETSQVVGVVQGEGALVISNILKVTRPGSEATSSIASLTLNGGALNGPGTVEVTSAFTANGGSMGGIGSTVLGSGVTGTVSRFGLTERSLVNRGILTLGSGYLTMSDGAILENLGILNVNAEGSETGIFYGAPAPLLPVIVNAGTLRKTAGAGHTDISINLLNYGTVAAETGTLDLYAESTLLESGSSLGGTVALEGPTVTARSFTASGNVTVGGATALDVEAGTATVANLTLKGVLKGAGTLAVAETLSWSSGSMSGTGSTVILPGASATANGVSIHERLLVNEGTLTHASGSLIMEAGAVLDNKGALNLSAEGSETDIHRVLYTTAAPLLINSGTIRKSAGTGTSGISIDLENAGTLDAAAGTLEIDGQITTLLDESTLEGSISFRGGSETVVGQSFEASKATIFSGGSTTFVVEGGSSAEVGSFTLSGGWLAGKGTLRVAGALTLTSGVMEDSGTTVLLPSGTGTITGSRMRTGRLFVNEGTTTLPSSYLQMASGAVLDNKGTFNANTQGGENAILLGSSPEPSIVNLGTFQKTAGTGVTEVQPNFQNGRLIRNLSGELDIVRPSKLSAAEKAGCEAAGDPVSCATGNFSESQTDLAIGGRGVGLNVTRSYSSQGAAAAILPGPFGYGWSGSFTDHLTIEESGAKVTVVRGSGQTTPFTRVSGTTYAAPNWSRETLSGSPEAGYVFTTTGQTAYRFSGAGRLESIVDRNGNETMLAYEAGQLKAVTDPAGRRLTFAYNAGGQVETATDPLGHVVKYAYEGGNLTSVTLPGEASPRWQFKYDGSHRITQVTDGRGAKTTNEYDSEGRVTSQTDPAGRTLAFKYESFHTTITNKATGEVTDEWFTSYNEPFSVTHGYGTAAATTRTFYYNEAGQLTIATDGAGHTTEYGYDSAGNRTSEKDPLGHETKWAFNSTHDLVSTTTPRGETTTIARDSHGNVESISRPAPGGETQTTSFKHGGYGELESATSPLGKTWSYGYDSYGDRTSETDPLGNKQTLAYDKDSRLTAIVSPRGNLEGAKASEYETKIERDAQGRPTKVTDPLGHATEYAYDANGNLASTTDAKGHTTKYTYNADDERTKVEKPSGATLETGYDGAGYVTSQTDGNGQTTTYTRNVLEQPVEVTDPLGRKTSEEFDAAGNLAKVTDPSGRETSYSYDAAGRLTGVNYSEKATPGASFSYDADGNLTAMSDGSGESSFSYDQLGRLTRSQDGHGDVVEYTYDLGEEQTGVVYPNGKSVSRAYDAAGRLESISDWLGGKTSFSYDAESNLKGISFPSGSGNVDEYAYDRASRMSEAKFKKGSETLASLTYTRDTLGQVEEEARHGLPGPEKVSYGYDQNNRLTKAGSSTYEYDAADNLTKAPGQANVYDKASQLEKGAGATYAYDKEGERTSATNRITSLPAYVRTFGGSGAGAGQLAEPRSAATDKEGNVWVADTAHNRIQEFNSKGEFVRQLGALGSANGEFNSPRGIAINQATGNVYVADSANNRIQEFNSEGKFIRKWGTEGAGNGQFAGLQALAIDAEGHVWTVEGGSKFTGNNRVQEFTPEGAYFAQFGKEGTEAGQFKRPEAIAADAAGNVWVADTENNRVQEFKPAGTWVRTITGSGAEALARPRGLAFDAEGKLWVADSGNDRLERFTSEGVYLAQFGAPGNNNGQLSEPRGIAIDVAGNIWIADTGNNRIQESTPSEFLRTFGGSGSGAGQLSEPRGAATDKEGNVWVADTAHNRIQEFNSKGEFLRQFGALGSANGEFNAPRGLAIDSKGNLWVVDTGNNRIQEFNAKGEFIRKFGIAGEENGQFQRPQALAIDPEGHLWTVELGAVSLGKPRVQEFSAEGAFIRQFGAKGSAAGQFSEPQGIAVDAAGNVWVADTANDRIQGFKPSGEFIRSFAGSGAEALSRPRGLAFDAEGKLWVADTGNDRLERFTSEGAYLAQFGAPGNNNGQFSEPSAVAVDAAGNLWIADTANNRVQESTPTEFIRTFGGSGSGAGNLVAPRALATDKEGNVWVADTARNRVQEFNSKGEFVRQFGALGSANGEFNSPRGIAISPAGNLYVADTGNNRVQEFNAKGEFLRKWGSEGSGNGQFYALQGLAVDSEGHVWTIEGGGFLGNNRVQEFSSEGVYLAQFGKEGTESGQFKHPEGIAVDSAGNVWVADTENNRLQEFKAAGTWVRAITGSGSEALSRPRGLAFDAEGNLWVADTGNDRLERFGAEGAYLAQFGAPGNESGQLAEPGGVAIDGGGNIWVADTGNNRSQEFAWPLNTTTYGYDQAGNLVSIQRPKAGENPAIEQALAYDATGLATAKTIGASTRHLAWDASAGLPLLLNDGENNYLYGPGGLPIEQINSKEEPTYLHHDQLGSTRLLTGSSGATTAAQSFAPYGTLEAKTGTATTPLGYAGQYTDAETGLQYLRARFYDPGTGQFMSRDPIAALTRQPYSYGLDSPLNWIDPRGLAGELIGGGCAAGEVIDPLGGCAPGALIGGGGELVNLAGGAILAWMASESSDSGEESSSKEESDCEPYPWNGETEAEIGSPDQEMRIARKEVNIDEMGRNTTPGALGPGGSPGEKAVKVAALLAALYAALHRH